MYKAQLHILRELYVFLFLVWAGAYSTDIFKMSGEMYLRYILKHFIYLNYVIYCILIQCKNAVA